MSQADLDPELFRRGDQQATLRLRAAVVRELRRLHPDPAVLEELTQAVMVDLFIHVQAGKPVSSASAWVHNVCRTHSRRELTRRARWDHFSSFIVVPSAALSRTVRAGQALAQLAALAAEFEEPDYSIFVLTAEGAAPAEIAKTLGLTPMKVWKRLHEIRTRLRAELERQSRDTTRSLSARVRAHEQLHSLQAASLW